MEVILYYAVALNGNDGFLHVCGGDPAKVAIPNEVMSFLHVCGGDPRRQSQLATN